MPPPDQGADDVRVWLLEGLRDAEPGVQAWGLDHLGLATWAPARSEVLAKVPAKFDEHLAWLTSHGLEDPGPDPGIEVVEEIVGDELLFTWDRSPATVEEIRRTISLLEATRADLEDELAGASASAIDWDPPYRAFLPWARWRTIRQIVAHLATSETHYYLANIGLAPPFEPVLPDAEPETYLAEHRAYTHSQLDTLADSTDPAAVDEGWSVRKVLRRLVWHERLHTRSIRRIRTAYAANQQA